GPGESVFDIVFHEGLSTADQTDINSGRGVGLSAVAAICRSWQGEAHIQPEVETGGTRMTLQFKQSA
ncbi:MAG: ATP-binding protein, partial [Pseudobdellovibrionaceae bacterium]|nr:ATP-binding protein [Pseudobdellovibrionaceae bacterium]